VTAQGLGPGLWRLEIGLDTDGDDQADTPLHSSEVEIGGPGTLVRLPALPARDLVRIELVQLTAEAAPPRLPDPAIGPGDLARVPGGLALRVHNLGAAELVPGPADRIVLRTPQGEPRQVQLPQLPALGEHALQAVAVLVHLPWELEPGAEVECELVLGSSAQVSSANDRLRARP
jgi:hypothetical protein